MPMNKFLVQVISSVLVPVTIWYGEGSQLWAQSSGAQDAQARLASLTPRRTPPLARHDELRFDALLTEIKELLRQERRAVRARPEKGLRHFDQFVDLRKRLRAEDAKARAYFDEVERVITRERLAPEILRRHLDFVRGYEAKYERLMTRLDAIEAAQRDERNLFGRAIGKTKRQVWNAVLGGTLSFLDRNTPRLRNRSFDPQHLPHRSLRADKPVPPKLTRDEWLKAFPQAPKSRAAADLTAVAPPAPEDLAETIEVKFTPEIRALADQLERNPVKIYNWVRNNIEFVPTWGSIQGAQLCLENQLCNAFDTASLLIALLRASGVPARYQMGKIEVPVQSFTNWAGGFSDSGAAAMFFASAGVPSVTRLHEPGGQVVSIAHEHIWVQAFVDYVPSQGARNLQGDTWIDLDPSFKQYSYRARADFSAALPADPQSLVEQVLAPATIDAQTGSVTGLDLDLLTGAADSTLGRIEQMLLDDPPVERAAKLFGSKTIVQQTLPLLPAGLPYARLTAGASFAEVPAQLRHSLNVTLGDELGVPQMARTLSLPELGGRRLALNYVAASEADAEAMAALALAQPQGTAFPSSLLVMPELRLDETPVLSGTAVGFGTSQILRYRFIAPGLEAPEIENTLTAGEQVAIGLNLARISPGQLGQESAYFADIKQLVEQDQFQALIELRFGERMLNRIVWEWFFELDVVSAAAAYSSDALSVRFPSAGLCFLQLQATTLFGAPRSAALQSLSLDVDWDSVLLMPKNADPERARSLGRIHGFLSSGLEASVPQRLFSAAAAAPRWGSSTTLLENAHRQGLPIVKFDAANAASILPHLSLSGTTEAQMLDALNAGMNVMTSLQPVSVEQFVGVGYIVEDPTTGAAAYRISGGLNGAATLANFVSANGTGLLVNILTEIAGGVVGLIGNIADLIQAFADCVANLASQGLTFGDALRNLATGGIIVLVAAAIAAWVLGPLASACGPIAVACGVLLGLLLVWATTKALQAFAGCAPPPSPPPHRTLSRSR
jgi:transglutaminase-like putative cysteine protease